MNVYRTYGPRVPTPQSQPIPGRTDMVQNNAGGFVFQISDWERLERFLVLGSPSSTYYVKAKDLTRANAECVERCIAADGPRTVNTIVTISHAGRAPKNDPALFALAMCISLGDDNTKRAAAEALPKVARTGTHLSRFVQLTTNFRSWGPILRRAVSNWFLSQTPEHLLFQAIKYNSREGWSMRDFLMSAHPKAKAEEAAGHAAVFQYILSQNGKSRWHDGTPMDLPLFDQVRAIKHLQHLEANTNGRREAAELIRTWRIPRECVPSGYLKEPEIWRALLQDMPITALIRNLRTMTVNGTLKPGDFPTIELVTSRLTDTERLRKGRVHPLALLVALKAYQAGHAVLGKGKTQRTLNWEPIQDICDALDTAFYEAFGTVQPIGNRVLVGVDVSGSMAYGHIAGSGKTPLPITPREGAAALAMQFKRTEPHAHVMGFQGDTRQGFGWSSSRDSQEKSLQGFVPLPISPRMRLDDVTKLTAALPFGPTDCAIPFLWANLHQVPVDLVVIVTDNESWSGDIHPQQAIEAYRQKFNLPTKVVALAMTATEYSIVAGDDPLGMNCVGFDTAVPGVIGSFARGFTADTATVEEEEDTEGDTDA